MRNYIREKRTNILKTSHLILKEKGNTILLCYYLTHYKPRGASPRCDYVLTRMVLCRYFSRYIFYMVRIGTSKKGGNAPRATDKKSM